MFRRQNPHFWHFAGWGVYSMLSPSGSNDTRNAREGIVRIAGAVFALFLLTPLSPGISAERQDAARSRADETALDLASFDLVWETVKETYHDSTLAGLDWQGIRDRLRPRMESASTIDEARGIIEEMLAPLNQSHFMLIPKDYYEGERTDSALAGLGVCGFDFRLVDGAVLVTSVLPDSPAFAAGVRPGWEVVRIGAVPVRETIDEIAELYRGRSRFEFELIHTLRSSSSGEIGDSGPALFRDGENREREIAIVLVKRPGRYIPAYGNLGPAFVDFEAKKLAGDIGYIRFNGFAGVAYLSPAFNGAMDSLRSAKGVIVDLRGNSGGIGGIALSMAGWFVAEKGTIPRDDREPGPRGQDTRRAAIEDVRRPARRSGRRTHRVRGGVSLRRPAGPRPRPSLRDADGGFLGAGQSPEASERRHAHAYDGAARAGGRNGCRGERRRAGR